MKIDENHKKPLDLFFQNFEKVTEEDLKTFSSRTIVPWNSKPPKYIISLLFKNLGFEKIPVDIEKINWIIYFKFKGKVFEIHDYKFNTWSLAVNNNDLETDKKIIEELVEEIIKILNKGSKYLDKKLSPMLKEKLKTEKFFFNNAFKKLYPIYSFYQQKLYELKEDWSKAETEVIEEEIDSGFGKLTSKRYIDHKREKEIESSYYFFPLISIYYSILEFLLDIFKCLDEPGIDYVEFRSLSWKDRFKSVFDLEDVELKKLYDVIVEIKDSYRNPLTHGLNNEVNLLVPIEGEGIVPISYEFLNDKPHFTSKIISIEKSTEYLSTLENFFNYLSKTEPYSFYWLYLQYDFNIPKSISNVENLKSHMTSIEEFSDYLDKMEEYYERKMNGEI